MGEISLQVVVGVITILIANACERARGKIKKPEGPRSDEPDKRRSIDRYWLRLAVGILNPKCAPQARSGETVRQTLTLVWDTYVWRRRLTRALAVLFALLAIYSVVNIILIVLN